MPHNQQNFGIVTERNLGRITIFDTDNLTVLHQIPVPVYDYIDVAITSDCTRALVSAFTNQRLVQIDLTQEPPVVIDDVPAGQNAEDVALTPNDQFGVTVDGGVPQGITSYSLPGQSIVDSIPNLDLQAVEVSPTGNGIVLGAARTTNQIRVLTIDNAGMLTDTGTLIGTGGVSPQNIAYHPSGNFAFVVNRQSDDIAVFDTGTNPVNPALLTNITTSNAPQTVIVSKDGTRVYVLTQDNVDVFSFSPSAPYLTPVTSFPHNVTIGTYVGVDQMTLDVSQTRLFISASGSGELAAFSIDGTSLGNVPGVEANGGVAACMLQQVQPIPRPTNTHTCTATVVDPDPIASGDPVAKVPVLLQEVSVQVPMQAEIIFPGDPVTGQQEQVLEIKTIKKRTFVTQCRLLNLPGAANGQLFISGFVRKNIQYAANPVADAAGEILSEIKSLTVEVPFDCVANVDSFINPPVGPFLDTRDEFGYLISKPLGTGYPEKDQLSGSDLSQFHQLSSASYNELPYCELVQADIIEIDESLNRTPFPTGATQSNIIGEGTFTRLSEKMILDLTLNLFQKQQVRVDSLGPEDEDS